MNDDRLAMCTTHAVCALVMLVYAAAAAASPPGWWASKGVVTTNEAADYHVAVQGQVKHLAKMAYLEMEANLPGGAGVELTALIEGFQNTNNYLSVNIGQVKALAEPFYDRLGLSYPWSGTTTDDVDYAWANLGQVKQLFQFEIGFADVDADGMSDAWELRYFPDLQTAGIGTDYDADGIIDTDEFVRDSDPTSLDFTILVITAPADGARIGGF